jgi:hypothetical protein
VAAADACGEHGDALSRGTSLHQQSSSCCVFLPRSSGQAHGGWSCESTGRREPKVPRQRPPRL